MLPVGWDPFSGYKTAMSTNAAPAFTGGAFGMPVNGTEAGKEAKPILNPGESTEVKAGKTSSPAECKTCKERKYQDGSNESNVSFQTAQHISPEAAGAAVRAHEGEHVANAYKKAAQGNGKVLQASVAIHTSVCPECGRTFVSGGTTTTKIKYGDEKNPYMKDLKARDNGLLAGMNFDVKG